MQTPKEKRMTRSIDIDQVVTAWAWREYDKNANRTQRNLREKEKKKGQQYINLSINWSRVRFDDQTVWPALSEGHFDEEVSGHQQVTNGDVHHAPETGKTHANILFQTTFANSTSDPQEYTLRTEKSTRSTCMTEIETGFTHGMETSVKLCTPGEILEANAGYHREMSLTDVKGETLEEELVWGVESQIRVRPEHTAEAELLVKEKKYSGEFEILTTVEGYVCVSFTNLKDNNSHLITISHDITEIIRSHVEMEQRKGVSLDFVYIENAVTHIKTKGKCQFRYGIKQEVRVNEKPMNSK